MSKRQTILSFVLATIFGTAITGYSANVAEAGGNNSFSTAQVIAPVSFTLSGDPFIFNSLIDPNVSIAGSGVGGFDYFRFTLDTGFTGVGVDIDSNTFDTEIGIWDAAGNLLNTNDDSAPDPGQNGFFASFMSVGGLTAGDDYIIGVGQFDTFFGDIGSVVPDQGMTGNAPFFGTYQLQLAMNSLTPPTIDLGVLAVFDEPTGTNIPIPFDLSLAADQNATLALFDDAGNPIDFEDAPGAGGSTTPSVSVLAGLDPGDYRIAVSGPGSDVDTGTFAGPFAVIPGPATLGFTNYTLTHPQGVFTPGGGLANGGVQWFDFTVESVPETSTLVAFACLLGGFGIFRFLKRRENGTA